MNWLFDEGVRYCGSRYIKIKDLNGLLCAAVSFIKVYIALAQQDMWPGDPFTGMD